jgi:hypothetical protein
VPTRALNVVTYFFKGELVLSRKRKRKVKFLRKEASSGVEGYDFDIKLTASFTCQRASPGLAQLQNPAITEPLPPGIKLSSRDKVPEKWVYCRHPQLVRD